MERPCALAKCLRSRIKLSFMPLWSTANGRILVEPNHFTIRVYLMKKYIDSLLNSADASISLNYWKTQYPTRSPSYAPNLKDRLLCTCQWCLCSAREIGEVESKGEQYIVAD